MPKARLLQWIKALHTMIWAIFVASILAIPIISLTGDLRFAVWLSVAVWVEIFVLAVNRPMTDLAARYDEHSDNFDIFLPTWLARHNKLIFGFIFAAAELFLFVKWLFSLWLGSDTFFHCDCRCRWS